MLASREAFYQVQHFGRVQQLDHKEHQDWVVHGKQKSQTLLRSVDSVDLTKKIVHETPAEEDQHSSGDVADFSNKTTIRVSAGYSLVDYIQRSTEKRVSEV